MEGEYCIRPGHRIEGDGWTIVSASDFRAETWPLMGLSENEADWTMAREYVWLECTECSNRNYRTPKEMRGTERLELKKFCPKDRRHTVHKESRKK